MRMKSKIAIATGIVLIPSFFALKDGVSEERIEKNKKHPDKNLSMTMAHKDPGPVRVVKKSEAYFKKQYPASVEDVNTLLKLHAKALKEKDPTGPDHVAYRKQRDKIQGRLGQKKYRTYSRGVKEFLDFKKIGFLALEKELGAALKPKEKVRPKKKVKPVKIKEKWYEVKTLITKGILTQKNWDEFKSGKSDKLKFTIDLEVGWRSINSVIKEIKEKTGEKELIGEPTSVRGKDFTYEVTIRRRRSLERALSKLPENYGKVRHLIESVVFDKRPDLIKYATVIAEDAKRYGEFYCPYPSKEAAMNVLNKIREAFNEEPSKKDTFKKSIGGVDLVFEAGKDRLRIFAKSREERLINEDTKIEEAVTSESSFISASRKEFEKIRKRCKEKYDVTEEEENSFYIKNKKIEVRFVLKGEIVIVGTRRITNPTDTIYFRLMGE